MRALRAALLLAAVSFVCSAEVGKPPTSAVLAIEKEEAPIVNWSDDWVAVVTWYNYPIFWLAYFPPQVKVRQDAARRPSSTGSAAYNTRPPACPFPRRSRSSLHRQLHARAVSPPLASSASLSLTLPCSVATRHRFRSWPSS